MDDLTGNSKNKCECGNEETAENTAKTLQKASFGNTGCCVGNNYETSAKSLEESEEDGCCCGGEFPDQSLVENPENPGTVADTEFFEDLEKLAHSMGIINIGYTPVGPELINTNETYPNAIVLTLKMGDDIIETAPGPEAQELNEATYAKMGSITYALSDFIRAYGFTTQVAHPYGSMVSFSPLGQMAGLGWIGQSGLLITPELGPRLKISAIFINIENLPLKEVDDHSWILDYCEKCGKCIKACPEKALIETETCCGGTQTEFIQKRCIGCTQGCTYCIEECPFDRKGYEHVKNRFDKMNEKLREKELKRADVK